MTKKFLLFFVLFGLTAIPVLADEDQGGEINQRDDNGRKQGKWIYFGKDRPTSGYPTEGKIEEGEYKDDRKEGTWIKYHSDGVTPKLKGEYINNRPNGAYVKIYPDGSVREKGEWARNKYQGVREGFHENGQVEYRISYDQGGKESGKVQYFYANGQVEFEYEAVDGVPTGKAVRYYENGDIKEIIMYGADGKVISSEPRDMINPAENVEDPGASKEKAPRVTNPKTMGAPFKPNAYNKVFNDNDEIWQDGDFRNGQLWNGKVYVYDSDGILLKVKVFKNGVYHSDGQL